jgi:hypothetical protein
MATVFKESNVSTMAWRERKKKNAVLESGIAAYAWPGGT